MARSRSAGIRPFQEEDIDDVARLWDSVLRSSSSLASSDTCGFLRRTLLSNPWADPELPSLVYVGEDGKIGGFVGCCVRRMVFDDRPIRTVCSSHLLIDPTAPARGVGALLLGRLLNGSQELSVTDTASAAARAMWEGLGGQTVHLGSVGWTYIFRPSHIAQVMFARRPGSQRWFMRPAAQPVRLLVDVALRYGIRALFPPHTGNAPDEISTEPLTPRAAAEHLPAITTPFRLRPDYDALYLESVFQDLDLFGNGAPVARLVRSGRRILGSYVYLLRPDSICPVLQVTTRERDADTVLRDLREHARAHKAAALVGRVEPHLQEALHGNAVFLFAAEARWLIHSRDPELLNTIHSGNVLMTLLDSEWWWYI